MPVELRKRKAPIESVPPPPSKKKSASPVKKAVEKVQATLTGKPAPAANGASSTGPPAVGDTISLEHFGGEVQTHQGVATTLAKLVADSRGGVVLFTYPKASTPGCTKQACLFRDEYKGLTATGFSIYGLSRDSPTANTTFVTKQSLPYPLLCDPGATLISAIGLKKAPAGTTRGVFVVDKAGKVLAAEPGGPDATVDVVRRLVNSSQATGAPMEGVKATGAAEPAAKEKTAAAAADTATAPTAALPATTGAAAVPSSGPSVPPSGALADPAKDAAVANVAAEVADSAQKVDQPVPNSGAGGALSKNSAKDAAVAKVAAEVADTAQKIDPATPNPA